MVDNLYNRLRSIQDADDDASVPFDEKGRRPYFTCHIYDNNGDPFDACEFLECIGFHVIGNAIKAAQEYLADNVPYIVDIFEEVELESTDVVGEPLQVWSSAW